MTLGLNGTRVLIVGASSGIGLATSHAFAEAGAEVVMASRGGDKLDRAVSEVGNGARALTLDTLDEASVAAAFGTATFDHVVVSAAATKTGPVSGLPLADAQAAMESKFWGAYRVARAAKITANGSLTFVSGFLSSRPSSTAVLQGAINAALESLARGLALELAPVRVNAVSPGLIDTPLYAGLDPAAYQSMLDGARQRLPVRRVGAGVDIARAILFVAANPFATGSTITVDGGGSIA